MKPGAVLIQAGPGSWLEFTTPVELVKTHNASQVMPMLRRVQAAVDGGLYAAGFISYEAAAGINPAFRTHAGSDLPLIRFGLYRDCRRIKKPAPAADEPAACAWKPQISRRGYVSRVERIRKYLKAGDTYQVNFTIRLRSDFAGDAYSLFAALNDSQQAGCGAYIDAGRFAVCSASPELFFDLKGREIFSRPMKGTTRRGLTLAQDAAASSALSSSEKNRAENVMIVDMIRNDLGRVAIPGSVSASRLFEIEKYPTVFQMTSTVRARTRASIAAVLEALFPCASITGAPKVRTMEIINELEQCPRGLYTGSIGYILPGGRARFNVAIRTVVVDRKLKTAEYGVGGGIVWDSDPESEYAECLSKAGVLTARYPMFDLLETILLEPSGHYYMLARHLRRLRDSAEYFGYPYDRKKIERELAGVSQKLQRGKFRVRLLLSRTGKIRIETFPILSSGPKIFRIALARKPVDTSSPFLYHKTTNRAVYEAAKAGRPDCDDVLLWNSKGEVTESTIANVVLDLGGKLVTPPVSCGLLPGVFRANLLSRRKVVERVISTADLKKARGIFLVNSVRKFCAAELI